MIVNDIFYSLQGEGFLAGTAAVFIRLAGCRLRCRWCDTRHAWPQTAGTDYDIDEIVRAAGQWDSEFAVITGGEPMINPQLPILAGRLKETGRHITIETAGIVFVGGLACDLMSISPKLSNSTPSQPDLAAGHEKARLDIAALNSLIDNYTYQLKFVVEQDGDLAEIQQTLRQLPAVRPERVILMPQAVTREEFLNRAPMVGRMCKESGFVFGQRLQVLLWNNEPGT